MTRRASIFHYFLTLFRFFLLFVFFFDFLHFFKDRYALLTWLCCTCCIMWILIRNLLHFRGLKTLRPTTILTFKHILDLDYKKKIIKCSTSIYGFTQSALRSKVRLHMYIERAADRQRGWRSSNRIIQFL